MRIGPNLSKLLFALPLLLGLASGCTDPEADRIAELTSPTFVGSPACESCHRQEYTSWQGSHHQHAMQVATPATVLGDFSGAEFEYFDTNTTFFMRDGTFIARTENETGEQQEFEITHTFGVEPLQQYLVNLPGGRKQALPFSWDSRSKDAGGQRWYHLYPDEYIAPDDPLHWTGRYFNWNTMCAECHSTELKVGYHAESNSYDTSFKEVSVGCESCHGPGSRHIEQARLSRLDDANGLAVDLHDQRNAAWIMNPDTGIAERSEPVTARQQAESCGRCHSRRSVLTDDYEYGKPLTDTHMPALLEENLYHADGRILDEVYVYGSFVQSKMYSAGVTCSDCHNPHSGALHTGPNPNDVCAQCHLAAKFASSDHNVSAVGNCVDCHMRATTYMGVDDRRDHSFRIPEAGQQNDHYGKAIAAGRGSSANTELSAALSNFEFPAIARATFLTLLQPPLNETDAMLLLQEVENPDPLVRIAALRSLRNQPAALRMRAGSHLLRDVVRGVRIEAALTYVEYRDLLPAEDARAFGLAADEYRGAMQASISAPISALNLAEFESQSGNNDSASSYYMRAITLDPSFAPARHAYGLFLVRAGFSDEALVHLRQATILGPENSRYAYVLGVALNTLGNSDEAVSVLSSARDNFPNSFDIGWALATILRDQGNLVAALSVSQELNKQFPNDARVGALIESLER